VAFNRPLEGDFDAAPAVTAVRGPCELGRPILHVGKTVVIEVHESNRITGVGDGPNGFDAGQLAKGRISSPQQAARP